MSINALRHCNQSKQAVTAAVPFVKWAGGKRRLLDSILAVAPATFERYLEPFVGGGAVALALGHRPTLLNDANPDLIAAYLTVRDRVEVLMIRLDALRAAHNEEQFYAVRALDPGRLSPLERAARLIYLNKTCFNGLWRVNRSGQFNTPSGGYVDPPLFDRGQFLAVSRVLQGSVIECGDYATFLDRHARAGDFVYLDPPYIPAGVYSDFKRYTKEQFRGADQMQLAEIYNELIRRGAYPVLSNSDTPEARALYRQHRLQVVHTARVINHQADGRGPVAEILVAPGRIM